MDRRYKFLVITLDQQLVEHVRTGRVPIWQDLESLSEVLCSQVKGAYEAASRYLKEAISEGGEKAEVEIWQENLRIAQEATAQVERVLTKLNEVTAGLKALPVLALRLNQEPKEPPRQEIF